MVDHDERVTLQEKVDAENAASIQQAQEQAAAEIEEESLPAEGVLVNAQGTGILQGGTGVDSDEDPE